MIFINISISADTLYLAEAFDTDITGYWPILRLILLLLPRQPYSHFARRIYFSRHFRHAPPLRRFRFSQSFLDARRHATPAADVYMRAAAAALIIAEASFTG